MYPATRRRPSRRPSTRSRPSRPSSAGRGAVARACPRPPSQACSGSRSRCRGRGCRQRPHSCSGGWPARGEAQTCEKQACLARSGVWASACPGFKPCVAYAAAEVELAPVRCVGEEDAVLEQPASLLQLELPPVVRPVVDPQRPCVLEDVQPVLPAHDVQCAIDHCGRVHVPRWRLLADHVDLGEAPRHCANDHTRRGWRRACWWRRRRRTDTRTPAPRTLSGGLLAAGLAGVCADGRFPASAERCAGASSSQNGGAQPSFSLHRSALMAQAQRRAGEHCLWSTYDQPKLNLAGLAAQRVTICGSCWAPRVPRLQVSRGVTELITTELCEIFYALPPREGESESGERRVCAVWPLRVLAHTRVRAGYISLLSKKQNT